MRFFYLLPVALQAIALASAQSFQQANMASDRSRADVSASLMNITFISAITQTCPNNTNTTTLPPDALSIAIRTLPDHKTCFNVEETFNDTPDATYSQAGYKCSDSNNPICGVNYTVIAGARAYRDVGNYSQILYTQIRNPFDPSDAGANAGAGRLQFQTYMVDDCVRTKDQQGHKHDGVRWNCLEDAGTCSNLPFNVRSFSIEMTAPEEVGNRSCAIAKQSAGVRGIERSGVALGVWVAIMVVGLVGFV
jgi:hypothetical protein